MSGIFNGVIRLRRDNDYNYAKIENTFIPANGEVCLVDTARYGLRAKVGDGVTVFAQLEYTDTQIYSEIESIIVHGYYKDGGFYEDSAYENKIIPNPKTLYVNITNNNIYTYDGASFNAVTEKVEVATSEVAGIMKLYETLGENTNGTMTQKAITDELNEKIEVQIDAENEMISFGNW